MFTTIFAPDKRQLLKVVAAFGAIYIIWGTTYLAIAVAVETMPPFLMAGARFVIAGLVTFAFLLVRGGAWPTARQWRSAAIIGAFLLVGGNGFVTWAEQEVSSGVAALVVATVPLWMALFDWLIYRSRRPGRRLVAGLALGFTGIALLLGPGQFGETAQFSWTALLLLFLAPVLWSLGSLQSRRVDLPSNAFMATAMEMLAGGGLLLLTGLLTGEGQRLDLAGISPRSWLALAYLTTLGSIVALTAYIWLLKTVQAAKVSTYTYVNPIIAVFLGWLILSELVTSLTLAAIVVIVLAVILITAPNGRRHHTRRPSPPVAVTTPREAADAPIKPPAWVSE